jgi:two-component system nitrogen regulation sensor histidine kinase NtrY
MKQQRHRFLGVGFGIVGLIAIIWLELFLQKKQHVIGGGVNRPFLFLLINAHIIIIVVLLYVIIRQIIKMFLERRKGAAGSVFRNNLAFAFILFSVIPSCFVFFTAGKFITKSIDRWFQARFVPGFDHALRLHEQHTQLLRAELTRQGTLYAAKIAALSSDASLSSWYSNAVSTLGAQYMFYVWDVTSKLGPCGSLRDEIRVWRTFRVCNDRTMKSLKEKFFQKINALPEQGGCFDFYGSLYFIKHVKNVFIVFIYRYPEVVRSQLVGLQNAIDDYENLYVLRTSIYTTYSYTFFALALLILVLSLWCAFYLAKGMSKPIQELLDATEKVRQGNWNVHVAVDPTNDLQSLSQGFNDMTQAVRRAHAQLEMKNREMLAILENLSAAVFLVNQYGRIIFCNAAAEKLVSDVTTCENIKDKKVWVLGDAIKNKFFEIARELMSSRKNQMSKEITFSFDNDTRMFVAYSRILVLINALESPERGLLVVLEDFTDIVKQSKMKTWQEAAKQLAHEIKNPLTPIQLATQRLQRRFAPILSNDTVAQKCTSTILEHVQIIKDLVTHFSHFASMPEPIIAQVSLIDLIHDVLNLYRMSYPDVLFVCESTPESIEIKTDKDKLRRVFINLLDNSVRALHKLPDTQDSRVIKIVITALAGQSKLYISFSDNGPGIAQSVRETLFLPYVSTEKKNMGLGLAIVHDIVLQLGGSINLVPTDCGAHFKLIFPL